MVLLNNSYLPVKRSEAYATSLWNDTTESNGMYIFKIVSRNFVIVFLQMYDII